MAMPFPRLVPEAEHRGNAQAAPPPASPPALHRPRHGVCVCVPPAVALCDASPPGSDRPRSGPPPCTPRASADDPENIFKKILDGKVPCYKARRQLALLRAEVEHGC